MLQSSQSSWFVQSSKPLPAVSGRALVPSEMSLSESDLAKAMLELARAEFHPPALGSLISSLLADGLSADDIARRLGITKYLVTVLRDKPMGDFVHGWG